MKTRLPQLIPRIALPTVFASILAVSTIDASSAQETGSIWSGVYSEAQAQRGKEQYNAKCASCHSLDLRGNSNSPSLLGMSFMFIWEGETLGDLFRKMRNEMPTDQPRSLPDNSYADILAYILQANSFPSGETDLGSNEQQLNGFLITPQSE